MKKHTVQITKSQIFGQGDAMFKNTYMGLANSFTAKYADQFTGIREYNPIDEEGNVSKKKVTSPEFQAYLTHCGRLAKGDALVIAKMLFDAEYPDAGFIVDWNQLHIHAQSCVESANILNHDAAKRWGVESFVQRSVEDYVEMFIKLGYIKWDGEEGNEILVVTDKYWTAVPTFAVLPQDEFCTAENRRFDYVKGGAKMSPLMGEAIKRLQDEAFTIDEIIFEIYSAYLEVPKFFKEVEYVIQNSKKMVEDFGLHTPLYSEWGGDSRARMYCLAGASANPQTSDIARSLYSHCVPNFVELNSPEYLMFLLEMEECAGNTKYWMREKVIRRVAANTKDYILAVLSEQVEAPAKPFTFARLCKDWVSFHDKGKCDSRVAFGLDAKNSGTQYLAVLAGDSNIAAATGITMVDKSGRVADPYVQSLGFLRRRVTDHNLQVDMDKITRDLVKTPYMAIQYRGTVNALLNSKDWQKAMEGTGLFNGAISDKKKEELAFELSTMTVDSIYEALGEDIMAFIEGIEEAVRHILEVKDITYFPYAMTDGFIVNKPCFKKWTVDAPESIRVAKNGVQVIFGDMKQKKDWQVTDPNPSGDEFIRTFLVNYIQGIDALVARTWVVVAKKYNLRGISAIHDCVRTCLADAGKVKDTIAETYEDVFVGDGSSVNKQLEHIVGELVALGAPKSMLAGMRGFNPVAGIGNEKFTECMRHENSYYFCQ